MEYQVHNVEWNDEKVKRFWDFHYNYEPFEPLWFTKAVGREIIKLLRKFVSLKGAVLDYGVGKGHLTNYLLEDKNLQVFTCDFSDETAKNTNQQFSDRPNFRGCTLVAGFPSPYSENQFDVVFLIEAIEHLTDNYLFPTLKEIHRILKPGGTLVITTPNNENLDLQNVVCPDCGCVFHRVQHVRSFDSRRMTQLMQEKNFNSVFCEAVDLTDYGKSLPIRLAKNMIRMTKGKNYSAPHLVYIGKK